MLQDRKSSGDSGVGREVGLKLLLSEAIPGLNFDLGLSSSDGNDEYEEVNPHDASTEEDAAPANEKMPLQLLKKMTLLLLLLLKKMPLLLLLT